jgi:hypothetical protein
MIPTGVVAAVAVQVIVVDVVVAVDTVDILAGLVVVVVVGDVPVLPPLSKNCIITANANTGNICVSNWTT